MGLRRGFSLIEVVVVVAVATIILGISTFYSASWMGRSAAKAAAQVFSRDLAQARAFAIRSQEPVRIRFWEDSLVYRVESEGGRELVRRVFSADGDIRLSGVDLEVQGDSIHFDARGLVALSGLGSAAFSAGSTSYAVTFNATGASRVVPR